MPRFRAAFTALLLLLVTGASAVSHGEFPDRTGPGRAILGPNGESSQLFSFQGNRGGFVHAQVPREQRERKPGRPTLAL